LPRVQPRFIKLRGLQRALKANSEVEKLEFLIDEVLDPEQKNLIRVAFKASSKHTLSNFSTIS